MRSLVALGALACFSAQALPTDTWPMYQGNPQHSGFVARRLHLDLVRALWTARAQYGGPGPITAGAISGTIISDGMVLTTPDTYFQRSAPLVAQSLQTGETLWSVNLGSVFSINHPAIDQGLIYVLGGSRLHSFQLDGTFLWRSPYGDQGTRNLGPIVVNGSVYFNGGNFGGIYSMSGQEGLTQWYTELPQMDRWSPTWYDGKLLAFTNELDIIDPATGTIESEITFPNGWMIGRDNQAPVVANGFAYVDYGDLLAFDLANHELAWSMPLGAQSQIATDGTRLYVVVNGALTVRDPADGSVQWSWAPPAANLNSNIIVTSGHVLVGDGSTTTYAINANTHVSEHTFTVGGALSYGADTLVIADPYGMLNAFYLPSTDGLFANGFE